MQTLELKTSWGNTEKVELSISCYANNNSLYVGLNTVGRDLEPYGDMTVNLASKPPNYCAFLDTGNMPELVEFVKENKLGSDTGLKQGSGFNEYSLYLFDIEKLRELCPDGLAKYEKVNGLEKKPEMKEKAR